MNMVVTDGIDLMPPAFIDGLDDWSSTDGTPGSPTYDGAANATLVTSDPDFGNCLEVQTIVDPLALRYMGEVPVIAGGYIEVSARIKVMSGAFPSARIAAWAGGAGGVHVVGLDEFGSSNTMDTYGRIYTVRAIIGSGNRTGVDMVWGTEPIYGHFGLDLTGAVGSIVRIESVEIKDATSYFYRKMMDWVDVRDYGAIGDGITDDLDAFEAADSVASGSGRDLVVSSGSYYMSDHLTLNARTRFEGTLVMADDKRLQLTHNYNLKTYIDAFGNEALALKKALQALFNFTDHESLDLGGLRVQLSAPIDVHAVVGNKTTFANRRVIRNGQIEATAGSGWDTETFTGSASYSSVDNKALTSVANIASIPIGSLVSGTGVGREVYVTNKDTGTGRITLSQPLHSAPASQTYTFTRFKYLLDFSGFTSVQRLQFADIEFGCFGHASALMLPKAGQAWHIRDCWFTKPKDRGITSIGTGCNGMAIDNNEFFSDEYATLVQYRKTMCFNTNSNDIKVRNNRAVRFLHFGVLNGGGHIITGNHFWQGDGSVDGERSAGVVLTQKSCKTTFVGNYIDNAWIELNNEHDVKANATPSSRPFGTLSITGNIFTASNVPAWFTYIRLSPFGNNHVIDGVTVTGNTFKTIGGGAPIDRVEGVDTSEGTFDFTATKAVIFTGNSFDKVDNRSESPALVRLSQGAVSPGWSVDLVGKLPFGGRALGVDYVTAQGAIVNGAVATHYNAPVATPEQGIAGTEVTIGWSEPVSGVVHLSVRVDLPL